MEQIIKQIASLASNGLNVGALADTPAILAHNDFSIQSLEHLQKAPNRIRQAVTVSTAKSLVDYVNKFKIDGTSIFCDLEKLNVKAIFDYHAGAIIQPVTLAHIQKIGRLGAVRIKVQWVKLNLLNSLKTIFIA